jgi:hypothetical protein
VQKSEPLLALSIERPVILQASLKYLIGTDNIGLNELARAIDRPVDVTFGRKVHHAIRSEVFEPSKEPPIGCDVGLYESILRQGAKIFKRTEVPRIGQRIDIQNLVASAEQIPNQVRADKASTTSD